MLRLLSGRRIRWLTMLAAPLLAWASLTRAQVRPQPPERHNPLRAAYMRAHFYEAMLLHDAVARATWRRRDSRRPACRRTARPCQCLHGRKPSRER